MTNIQLMKRAAVIAGNTKCWIGMGCVIARDGKVLAEAWNETLEGEEYCREFRERKKEGSDLLARSDPPCGNKGCVRHDLGLSQGREIEKVCSVHAEANAIAKAARQGTAIDGATMFITSFPCLICIRSIIAAGIKKVVYMNDFYKPHHTELLKENEIEIERIPEEKAWRRVRTNG